MNTNHSHNKAISLSLSNNNQNLTPTLDTNPTSHLITNEPPNTLINHLVNLITSYNTKSIYA